MTTPDPLTLHSIDLFLSRVRSRYAIAEAYLYGSRATGTAREDSDVDLALVLGGEGRAGSAVAAEMGGDTFDVMAATGRYVVPMPIAIAHWQNPELHPNPYLLASIRRDGIAL